MTHRLLCVLIASILLLVATTSADIVSPDRIVLTSGPKVDIPLISVPAALPNFKSFVTGLKNGQSDLTGIYAGGQFAFKVIQQPVDNPAFVSTQPETLTQFRMAGNYKTIGLLGHDYLAGGSFFSLKKNQEIILVSGNGSTKYFKVDDIQRFQALSPESPYSRFVDLMTQEQLSAEELFNRIYARGNLLVLQTCIPNEKISSWGRIFVIAKPINHLTPSFDQLTPAISNALQGIRLMFQPAN
jgi:hypothetical protein